MLQVDGSTRNSLPGTQETWVVCNGYTQAPTISFLINYVSKHDWFSFGTLLSSGKT